MVCHGYDYSIFNMKSSLRVIKSILIFEDRGDHNSDTSCDTLRLH